MNIEKDEQGKFMRGVAGRFLVGKSRIDCVIMAESDEDLARLAKRLRVSAEPQMNKRTIIREEKRQRKAEGR